MATYAENLEAARNNVAANLAAVTASPKPTYSVDGESYNWGEYFQLLTAQLAALNEQLAAAGGPYEVRSYGC